MPVKPGSPEVKKDQFTDSTTNSAQQVEESCKEAGQMMMSKAQGATDAVKDGTGMKK